MNGGRAIDLQQLMANPRLRRAFTERFTPLHPGMDVGGMAMMFAGGMLSTAANVAPRSKRNRVPARRCASEETKGEILAAWQEREAAREVRARLSKRQQPREESLKSAEKCLKRVRIEAGQRCSERFVSQLEARIKDGDQSGFYEHLRETNFKGKKSCSSQYTKDAEGSLLRDMGLIRDRWVQWFSSLLNT